MFPDYVEFKCIKKMSEDNRGRFVNIVNEYEKKLNKIVSDGGAVYTLHDFEHHCCNLYKIVSDVILNTETAFGQNESSISQWELYILNLAILLHDIGMTPYIDLARDNHSVVSAKKIKEDYKNASNPLSEGKSGLSKNDIDALALIVQAHSDVIDESIQEGENGLNNPDLTNSMPGRWGKIRARFLANILRLADELDVTSARLGPMDVRNELEEAAKQRQIIEKKLESIDDEKTRADLQQQLERYKKAEFSNMRWKSLSYFKSVECDSTGKVTLYIDDNTIDDELALGVNDIYLAKEILKVYEKIAKEFEKFRSDVETDLQLDAMIAIKKFDYLTKNKAIQQSLDELKKKPEQALTEEIVKPHVISTELESKISMFIEKRNLYEVGHFRLHDNLCARDWVSIEEIISTEEFFKKCEAQLLLHLKTLEDLGERYIIIGIDFYGMLMASRLAFILQKPYTYLIPDFRKSNSSTKELDFGMSIEDFDSAIIVTDVIVTFDTIKKLTEKYNMLKKIKAIYAILFRNTDEHQFVQNNQDIAKVTHVLNSKYNIEIQSNDNCRYKDKEEQCKALNKTYN